METTSQSVTTSSVQPSNNSLTAKSGFKAEYIFRNHTEIKSALEQYFGKKITLFEKIHGKKYDTKIYFDDGSSVKIQNKKIQGLLGRGDSFDRRTLEKTFTNQDILSNLKDLTISRRNSMTTQEKNAFANLCNNNIEEIHQYLQKTFCGNTGEENEYWAIFQTDKNFSFIKLYIISTEKFYNYLKSNIAVKICRTCMHLSPQIYLQRKGGGSKDHSPNDIQAKLKVNQEMLDLCDKIL